MLALLAKVKLVQPEKSELQALPEDCEMLKLIGFSRKAMDEFLNLMKKHGFSVPYKCIETETNKGWTLRELYEELRREHSLMQQGKEDAL